MCLAMFSQMAVGMHPLMMRNLPDSCKHTMVHACFYDKALAPQNIPSYKARLGIGSPEGKGGMGHLLCLQPVEGKTNQKSTWLEMPANNTTALSSCARRYFAQNRQVAKSKNQETANNLGMLLIDPMDSEKIIFVQFDPDNTEYFLNQVNSCSFVHK